MGTFGGYSSGDCLNLASIFEDVAGVSPAHRAALAGNLGGRSSLWLSNPVNSESVPLPFPAWDTSAYASGLTPRRITNGSLDFPTQMPKGQPDRLLVFPRHFNIFLGYYN